MNTQPQFSYILLAIVAAVCMGTIGTLARFAALPAEHITFYRLFLGAVCLVFYMLYAGKGTQIYHRPSKRTLVNGILLAAFMVFYIQAMSYTSMANAVMLIYLAPLLCAVIAHFIFSEKLVFLNFIVIALALIGFAMMMEFSISLSGSAHESLGLFYGVLSLLSYSGFMLINRKPSESTPYQSTLVQLIVGALCMLPFVMSKPILPTFDQSCWLFAIGVLPGFIAILCAVKALRNLPSITFGTIAYLEPVAVVCFAWGLFGETLYMMQLLGCSFIIFAGIAQGVLSNKAKT